MAEWGSRGRAKPSDRLGSAEARLRQRAAEQQERWAAANRRQAEAITRLVSENRALTMVVGDLAAAAGLGREEARDLVEKAIAEFALTPPPPSQDGGAVDG